MVTISRGDVVLCDLNPVIGTEQSGLRPVVILQINRANAVSPHTIIAPFTTKIRRALLPSHVFVPAGTGGLIQDSVVLCEQIRVIDKRRITKVLGHLDEPYLEKIAKSVSILQQVVTHQWKSPSLKVLLTATTGEEHGRSMKIIRSSDTSWGVTETPKLSGMLPQRNG